MSTSPRPWMDLPTTEVGDRVAVEYDTRRSSDRQRREGEVVEVVVNGFAFDADSGQRINVRQHEALTTSPHDVMTRVTSVTDGSFGAHLNLGHDYTVTVEVDP